MSTLPSPATNGERDFLRDIALKPFDEVTVIEFVRLLGIANRVVQSETGKLDLSDKARLADALDDVKRLHEEKMKFFERTIELERELATAKRQACTSEHWVYAFWRAATSKKGVSALEIRRQTRLSYKSALFMMHRIRHAMAEVAPDQLGGAGKIVEADEAYWGTEKGKTRQGKRAGGAMPAMNKVFALVERGGRVRSMHVPSVTGDNLKRILEDQVAKDTHVMTDSSPRYNLLKRTHGFAKYDQVNHSKGEYVRGIVYTNSVENYFSILKRGLHGIYHHVSTKHLHRYLSEFDFRYTNRELSDGERTSLAIKLSEGKRLMYVQPAQGAGKAQ